MSSPATSAAPAAAGPGIRWPRLGLGCAALGTPAPGVTDATAAATLDLAWERGIRCYDVAPLYGGGLAEERLGRMLRDKPRNEYVLCTKTGVTRPYGQPATPPGSTVPRSADRWDYGRAATRASVLRSLERLGVAYLDVVHLHDAEDHLDAALDAYAELEALRAEGLVCGIGIGSNLVAPVQTLLGQRRFDAVLLAGRYTLLDTSGATLIADAAARGVAIVAGGIYNSGILATGPRADATFAYRPAAPDVRARAERLAAACARHAVPLATAALQFVLANPAVRTVLLGPRTPAELEQNLAAAAQAVPAALAQELAAMASPPQPIPLSIA
ncbi:MAG: aldo/keto reductase [Proteobacteria bacterium]|nr:aldo/keto reductase [Pseudomonadota bacterium]